MTINAKQKKDLNRQDRASQNVQLGTIIQNLEPLGSGSQILITGGSAVFSDLRTTNFSASFVNSGSIISNFITSGSAKFGDANNYAFFSSNGTLSFSGSATAWEDLVVPLTTAKQGANNKPVFDETNVGYLFPASDTTAIMFMIVQLPHSWKEGSNIHPHVHCRQSASGSPVFKMNYTWTNIGDTISASAIYTMSNRTQTYTSGSLHQLINYLPGLDGTGKKISSILLIKLYRDDAAYTGDLLTYQFDIHFQRDSLGSDTELVK